MTYEELIDVLEAFEQEGVEYVVIGGAAVNAHGLVRATEDLDVIVRPTRANIGRLRRALRRVWDDPCIEEITHEDLAGDYPAVRYVPPTGEIYLDIVARLGEAWRYENIDTQRLAIGPVEARVATPEALYRMKKDTVRDVDRADARALRWRFDIVDETD